jgi:hypothetical protein
MQMIKLLIAGSAATIAGCATGHYDLSETIPREEQAKIYAGWAIYPLLNKQCGIIKVDDICVGRDKYIGAKSVTVKAGVHDIYAFCETDGFHTGNRDYLTEKLSFDAMAGHKYRITSAKLGACIIAVDENDNHEVSSSCGYPSGGRLRSVSDYRCTDMDFDP